MTWRPVIVDTAKSLFSGIRRENGCHCPRAQFPAFKKLQNVVQDMY